MELKIGDIVARKSYGSDILFKVTNIKKSGSENIITLKGISYRIEADAPEADLVIQSDQRIYEHQRSMSRMIESKVSSNERAAYRYGFGLRSKKALYRDTSKETAGKFSVSGKVLHLDGDKDYLDACLEQYKKFNIDVIGVHVAEKDQAGGIVKLIKEHKPDILVLTGHDGMLKGDTNYNKLDNYRNSKYFINAVTEARKHEEDLDRLIIFAGACQSMYNEIINAGANYASAPYRVLIHAYDPVLVCKKIVSTGIDRIVDPSEVVNGTITGYKGIGGLQTRGKYRGGYPAEPEYK